MIKKSEVVLQELKKIENSYGLVTPKAIVEEAESELSPLHDYFQWDDTKAANEFRLWQAREMIAKVRITFQDRELDAYYNVRIMVEGEMQQGYASLTRVISEKSLRVQVINQALRELEYWQIKYSEYKELENLVNVKRVKELSLHTMKG